MRSSGCCVGEVLTMEVPLALQDPVPLGCFAGVDGDADDVPPSPTPDPTTPTLAAGTFFQRGFLDCAQEALRFLTEEEGMSEDNPVVAGLRHHLVHATPHFASPTSTGVPVGVPPVFTFTTPAPCMVRSKHQPTSTTTRPAAYTHLPSTLSERGRFSPYAIPCRRSLAPACSRREADKNCVTSEGDGFLRQCSSATPSTQSMERVLTDDLISADDLQGVLRCLGSGHSHSPHSQSQPQCSVASPTSSPISSSPLIQLPTCIESCVSSEHKTASCHNCGLDDSGVSEASSTELVDEVDSMNSHSPAVCGQDSTSDIIITSSSAYVSVLDRADCSSTTVSDENVTQAVDTSSSCTTADSLTHDIPLTNGDLSSCGDSHLSLSTPTTVSASVPCSASSTSTAQSTGSGSSLNSSPTSQLALLSSLSSGTHRLTCASADSGDATASRIQSLASQILLLLSEEAEAQDYSDNDDDEDDDSLVDDSDLEEGSLDLELEAEP